MATKTRWTVQISEGKATKSHPSIGMFIATGAQLRCQINPTSSDQHGIGLDIGYDGGITLYGSLADLRRAVELLRTTLEEYGDGPTA